MTVARMPDTLLNSLIRNKESGEVKRVIRDDGENGLHISPVDSPVMMRPISRDDFRKNWVLHQTVSDQLKEDSRTETERPFRNEHAVDGTVVRKVDIASQTQMPTIDSRFGVDDMDRDSERKRFGSLARRPFEGRAVPTDRGDGVEDYISTEATDATFSGQPVGGNEEPAELFEEERADPDAAEADSPLPKKTSRKKTPKSE